MFEDLQNFYVTPELDAKSYGIELAKIRAEIYNYDKNILDCHVVDFENFDFSGRFDFVDENIKLQCLFINSCDDTKKLHIVYNAARNAIFLEEPNYFNRWSYYKIIDGCFLGIDDPMYLIHPKLLLGWFWGTKDICYIDNTARLIKKICDKKEIPLSECTFFSSSGGGFASILGAIAVPGSLSISINPQLYIQNWVYTKKFEEIVGVSLSEPDPLLRNNLALKITNESKSKHIIIVNIQSVHDFTDALKLANDFGVKQLRYGLNLIRKNLLVWVYDAMPKVNCNAHTTFENKQIFKFIEYIANQFRQSDYFDTDKYQNIVTIINEIWHEQSRMIRQFSKQN